MFSRNGFEKPEIDYDQIAVFAPHDILRLEIAMDQSLRVENRHASRDRENVVRNRAVLPEPAFLTFLLPLFPLPFFPIAAKERGRDPLPRFQILEIKRP